MSKCQSGWSSQHKFEARFDKSDPILPNRQIEGGGRIEDFLEVCRRKTYVHDICVKCGEVVKRDAQGK